jgi:hypothetical protein
MFFRSGLAAAASRLLAYSERAASEVLDEPATARALSGYLRRGLDCGAFSEDELGRHGLERGSLSAYTGPAAPR